MTALAVTTAAAVLGLAGPADAATPVVSFTRAQFDSPGTDNRTNASLNAEWVRLTNNTTKAIQLKGWTVRDVSNHVYTFPAATVPAKRSIYLHTGKGKAYTDSTGGHLFWGSGNYIWNNTGDTAYLRNTAAKTIDTCTWKSGTKPVNC